MLSRPGGFDDPRSLPGRRRDLLAGGGGGGGAAGALTLRREGEREGRKGQASGLHWNDEVL